jgi:hypothetical protein
MQGPEGRPPNVSPARKGWEIDPEEDPSAVGAALNRSSALPVSLGAYPRDLQFRGPFLEMFFDRAQRSGEICGFFFGFSRTLNKSWVPHISLVFREMWDTTTAGSKLSTGHLLPTSSSWVRPSVPGVLFLTATSAPADTLARPPTQQARFPRPCPSVPMRSTPGRA